MAKKKYSTDDFGGGGKFIKWNEEGMTVSGKWVRVQPSQFRGPNGETKDEAVVMVDGEEKIMPLTTALLSFFMGTFGGVRKVPEGADFEITYSGTRHIKGQASPMKVFDVTMDDELMLEEPSGF